MSARLDTLAQDWIRWLNNTIADPALPLYARRSPNDAGNEDDSHAAVHIHLMQARPNILVMAGVICIDLDCDDEAENILASEVFYQQIRQLGSAGPFLCFVAHGESRVSFHWCEDGSAGRDGQSENLTMQPLRTSFDRNNVEQQVVVMRVLMNGITANIAKANRATI